MNAVIKTLIKRQFKKMPIKDPESSNPIRYLDIAVWRTNLRLKAYPQKPNFFAHVMHAMRNWSIDPLDSPDEYVIVDTEVDGEFNPDEQDWGWLDSPEDISSDSDDDRSYYPPSKR